MSASAQKAMSANLLAQTLEKISSTENPTLRGRIERRFSTLNGRLGRLEDVILQYGLATDQWEWLLPKKALFVFCADHGAAVVSSATYERVRELAAGRTATSVICRESDIDPVIVDMGVDHVFEPGFAVIDRKIAPRTKNLRQEPAMTREEAIRSIEVGIRLAQAAQKLGYQLAGIGAIADGSEIAANAVLASTNDPLSTLTAAGGFETGGMTGFLLGAASVRIPVCIDGPSAKAAAVLAAKLAPNVSGYLFHSEGRSLVDLELQTDAGAGAALTMDLISTALQLYLELTSR